MGDTGDFECLTDAQGVSYCFPAGSLWFYEGMTYEEYQEARKIKHYEPDPDPDLKPDPEPEDQTDP